MLETKGQVLHHVHACTFKSSRLVVRLKCAPNKKVVHVIAVVAVRYSL